MSKHDPEEEFVVDCPFCEDKYVVINPLRYAPEFCAFCAEPLEQSELDFNE